MKFEKKALLRLFVSLALSFALFFNLIPFVTDAASDPVINSFIAFPNPAPPGQAVTLSWVTANATSVKLLTATSTSTCIGQDVNSNGQVTVFPSAVSTQYSLFIIGPTGNCISSTVTVTLTQTAVPTINTFTAIPSTIVSGQSISLAWTTTNATSVELYGPLATGQAVPICIGQGVATNGSQSVYLTNSASYVLFARNSAGCASKIIPITVRSSADLNVSVPGVSPVNLRLNRGATSTSVAAFNFSTGALAVNVRSLRLLCQGCSDPALYPNDLSKISLFDGNTQIATSVNWDFSFDRGQFSIPANSTKTITVKSDIVISKITADVQFNIQLNAVAAELSSDNSTAAISSQMLSAGTNIILASPTAANIITVSLDQSTPASAIFNPGQLGAVFAKINLKAGTTDVNTLNNIEISSDLTDASGFVGNIKIFDGTAQLGAGLTTVPGRIAFSNISIPANTNKVLTLTADVAPYPKSGSLHLGITGLTFGSPGSSVVGLPLYGNMMTIAGSYGPTLAVAIDPATLAAQTIRPGNGISVLQFQLMASSISDVAVTGLQVSRTGATDCNFSNYALYDGSMKIGSAAPDSSCKANFSGLNLVVAKNASKLLSLKLDIAASASPVTFQLSAVNTASSAGTVSVIGLPVTGSTITVSAENSSVPLSFPDGLLLADNSTLYLIEFGKKRPFGSFNVFNDLGFNETNVQDADTSNIAMGAPIISAQQRHTRGTLVSDKGTIYFMGKDVRYPFPLASVFLSWGNKFEMVIAANSFDLAVPIGPVAVAKQ